ncbi:hypothetical protein VNO78_31729 [Psophocarpus tetragonolobus]|uniref:PGG domain-containing protein n=1 Tax=Psophocarpus tetragonolobus TaxID=3891 RepID=A0AAN9X7W3_PSOTE
MYEYPELTEYTLEGKWGKIVHMYKENPECRRIEINESRDTALHVAVDLNKVGVVKKLLEAMHLENGMMHLKDVVAKNKRGDTPLHVAASRGFATICKLIIDEFGTDNKDKHYLSRQRNNNGETPLFQAAMNGHKQAFAYLSHILENHNAPYLYLVRNNGDTALHCAISNQYLDLAVIIMHYYDILGTQKNNQGIVPLKVLATRPSAFPSATNFLWSWWHQILYCCILVQPLDPHRKMKAYLAKMDKQQKSYQPPNYPINYATLYDIFNTFTFTIGNVWKNKLEDTENPPNNVGNGFLPPNYETFEQFVRSAFIHVLGLSGVELKEVKKAKQRHQWGRQLFEALMKRPFAAYTGAGGIPEDTEIESISAYDPSDLKRATSPERGDHNDIHSDNSGVAQETSGSKVSNKEQYPLADEKGVVIIRSKISWEVLEERKPKVDGNENNLESNTRNETDQHGDEKNSVEIKREIKDVLEEERQPKIDDRTKDSPFLLAAGNGIVEMVKGILIKVPSVIHETNSQEENVLLVAVRNKKPLVVKALKNNFESDKEVWNTLTLGLDKNGQTILHKAASAPGNDKPWQISGSALQMMWDVNWFQYVRRLVPEHYYLRNDKQNQSASEIFKEEHKELRKESSEWLRETSESCSVVAALVAGVSFATAASIPGDFNDFGKPRLEHESAFDAFVIASLLGLFFSVTGLIMFLTILTSRKLHKEFRRDLPFKLLLGLSSLFVSIVALLVSFCTSHSFLFAHKYKMLIFPLYLATCLPVTFYAIAQLPLYFDLLRGILVSVPRTSNEGDSL